MCGINNGYDEFSECGVIVLGSEYFKRDFNKEMTCTITKDDVLDNIFN